MRYAEFLIIYTGPYVILAAMGIILFWRLRTIATALLALGFLVYVVGQVSSLFIRADISKTYNAHGDVTSVVESFHGWAWTLSRYAGTAGMWIAAVGATMYVLRRGRTG